MDREQIISAVRDSACFVAEAAYVGRNGFEVADRPRLFKHLEGDRVRLIFPTQVTRIEEGVVVAMVCLFNLETGNNVYAHAISAGPGVNASLKNIFVPEVQTKPQPGIKGNKAILKFVAWKQAAWTKFLNDELELGTDRASAIWMENFWKALDRMYGGGALLSAAS